MIIVVDAGEEEHDRYTSLGEFVVVASSVELVWILVVVVRVVESDILRLFVRELQEAVKLRADLVGSNHIDLIRVLQLFILLVHPSDHVGVEVSDSLLERDDWMFNVPV